MYSNTRDQGEDEDELVGAQLSKKFDESEVLDFVNGMETLNVVVERPIAGCRPMDANGMEDGGSYTLPSDGAKGLALALNIVEFDNDITNVHRRYGSEQDMEYLTDLFIQLDYILFPTDQEKREQKNKSKSFLQSLIRLFKMECKRLRPKSIIVFIGSHGRFPNQILTSDYQWMDLYKDIVFVFTQDTNFTELDGKPKIFLVQACRKLSDGDTMTTHVNVHQGPSSSIKDVYIGMATKPGEPSMRHFYKGSWFPYCFTYMMMKHALKMKSLQQIMEMVKTMLGQIKNYNDFKQVPSYISINCDKPLYFVGSDYDSSPVRNYRENPTWLPSSSKFCIISTTDKQITCEKITESLPKYIMHEWSVFAELVSSKRCRLDEGVVDVVKGCTMKDLQLTLGRLDKVNRERVIFITSEKKQSILKLNPSNYKVDVTVDQMLFQDLSLDHQFKIIERLENKYGIILEKEQLNGELLVDIISGREMYRDKIRVRQLRYYVNRTVLTRNIISTEIFNESYSNDIFLIHGIKRIDLSVLVKHDITGRSQEQLENITVTFMTLDKASHFDKICKMTCKSVHMLNYEKEKFRWIRSIGNIGEIQKHVAGEQNEEAEEDFCSMISSASPAPVCISDSPGMGKTILLAHIGRRLRRMFPDRTVLFVELNMFIQRIKETKITDNAQAIKKALQDIVCKTLLGRHILKSKLTSGKVSIELLLDGFDEVSSTEIDFAHGILKTLRLAFSSIRMWVTSRPHKLQELEITLGGLGFNIKPFRELDQVNFLKWFWSQHTKLNTVRLENFARHCLKSLKSKMNSCELDIAGIPLQCLLIGEVYEEKAIEHAKIGETYPLPDEFHISSITTLYQKVIKKKVRKYKSAFGSHKGSSDIRDNKGAVARWLLGMDGKLLRKDSSTTKGHGILSEAKLNDIHAHLGISLIFPDMFRKLEYSFDLLDMEEILNVGIWEFGITTGPRFIHRTFAEYFVALFIADRLISGSEGTNNLTALLLAAVLSQKNKFPIGSPGPDFASPVMAYFLNSLLVTDDGSTISPPAKVAHDLNRLLNGEVTREMIYACAYGKCENICKFCHDIGVVRNHASVIFDQHFYSLAMEQSGLELVRLGFHHMDDYGYEEFISLDKQWELLLRAVQLGQFCKVEFLLKNRPLPKEIMTHLHENGLWGILKELNEKTKMLLHHGVTITNTNSDMEAEIDQRIGILRLLDGINGDLKEQTDDWGRTPLFAATANVRLIQELIHLGANITTQDRNDDTVLHRCDLSKEHYHDLVRTLKENGNLAELVLLKNNFQRTPLQTVIENFDPLLETLQMFKDSGADFNCTDEHGRSVLMTGVRSIRNVSTLQNIIKFGADKCYKTGGGDTLLHQAAELGFDAIQILNFLVKEHKLDVNAKNKSGHTPLDIVLGCRGGCRGTKYFEFGITLFVLGGRDTNTVNQWRRDQIYDEAGYMTPIYVDMLLLQLYIFGTDETIKYSSRSAMNLLAQTQGEMTSPPTFRLNYIYLKKLLISRGATGQRHGPIRRLNDILVESVGRTPSIWDVATIQLLEDGKLVWLEKC